MPSSESIKDTSRATPLSWRLQNARVLAGKNRFGSVIFKEERVCQYNFSGHKLRELYRSHFAAILMLQWLKETSCDNRVTT